MNMNTLCIRVWIRRKLRSGALGCCSSRVSRSFIPSRSLIGKEHDVGNATRTLRSKATTATTTTSRRGGLNLNERFSRYSYTGRPTKLSQLSEPGMAHQSSQEAASRLARENEEYHLVASIRIPKKPRPPADDGSSQFLPPLLIRVLFCQLSLTFSSTISDALCSIIIYTRMLVSSGYLIRSSTFNPHRLTFMPLHYFCISNSSMSGCAVCVYDLYIEAKSTYTQALSTSLTSLKEHNVPSSSWPKEVLILSKKQSNDARATADAAADDASSSSKPVSFQDEEDEDGDDDDRNVDASMKAFMELEKRLKKSS